MSAFGKLVIYHWRAGQVRAGQTQSVALVTKLNPDGTANLKVFPDDPNGDLWFRSVPPMSDAVKTHCFTLQEEERKPTLQLPQKRN